MTAWQRLKAKSSLLVGTAWQHLTSQQVGAGTVIIGGMHTATVQLALGANKQQALSANTGKALTANSNHKRLTASINANLEGSSCQ